MNAASDPDYATATPGEIATLAATRPLRKLTKVQMTATVETERKTYTAGRLAEQVGAAEEKDVSCATASATCLCAIRSGYRHYAPDAYASCRPGGTLYGYMGNLRASSGMTAVAYHPKPRASGR